MTPWAANWASSVEQLFSSSPQKSLLSPCASETDWGRAQVTLFTCWAVGAALSRAPQCSSRPLLKSSVGLLITAWSGDSNYAWKASVLQTSHHAEQEITFYVYMNRLKEEMPFHVEPEWCKNVLSGWKWQWFTDSLGDWKPKSSRAAAMPRRVSGRPFLASRSSLGSRLLPARRSPHGRVPTSSVCQF